MLVECGSCGGTGLYQGFAEEKGYPVICVSCKGKGAGTGSKPYTGRKLKDGVLGVRANGTGAFFTAPRHGSPSMSYQEFQERYPAPPVE